MSNLLYRTKIKIYSWFDIPEWKVCGYTSERAWKKKHDPKIFKGASTVSNYFCGYPYIVEVPYTPESFDAVISAYNNSNNYFELFDNWAEENNIEDYHFEFLRSAGNDITEFGYDRFFAGFTHEDNAMWFKLRWC